jgi:Zn finger protein HypA/HybF involved in hydrogenase expression
MIAQTVDCVNTQNAECVSAIGNCLNCGRRLSYCGKPFTTDIACPVCGAVNVYLDSQQPIRLLETECDLPTLPELAASEES